MTVIITSNKTKTETKVKPNIKKKKISVFWSCEIVLEYQILAFYLIPTALCTIGISTQKIQRFSHIFKNLIYFSVRIFQKTDSQMSLLITQYLPRQSFSPARSPLTCLFYTITNIFSHL